MTILTTCIGAYPKPDYVPMRDWFQVNLGLTETSGEITRRANRLRGSTDPEVEALYCQATGAGVADQTACGVDIPTDGAKSTAKRHSTDHRSTGSDTGCWDRRLT